MVAHLLHMLRISLPVCSICDSTEESHTLPRAPYNSRQKYNGFQMSFDVQLSYAAMTFQKSRERIAYFCFCVMLSHCLWKQYLFKSESIPCRVQTFSPPRASLCSPAFKSSPCCQISLHSLLFHVDGGWSGGWGSWPPWDQTHAQHHVCDETRQCTKDEFHPQLLGTEASLLWG